MGKSGEWESLFEGEDRDEDSRLPGWFSGTGERLEAEDRYGEEKKAVDFSGFAKGETTIRRGRDYPMDQA